MDDLSLHSPPTFLFLVAQGYFPFFFTSFKLSSNPPVPTGRTRGLLLQHFWQKASIRRDGRFFFLVCFLPSPALQLITIFSVPRGEETTCVPLSRLLVKISRWVKRDEGVGGERGGGEYPRFRSTSRKQPRGSNLGVKLAIWSKTSGEEKKTKNQSSSNIITLPSNLLPVFVCTGR